MNILLLIPNLGRGGAQKVFRDQLEFLRQHANVTGCVFNMEDILPEDNDLNIISLNVHAGKNIAGKALNFISRIIKLRRLKRKLQIELTISHLEGADYVNILSRQKDKVFCWIHGTKKFDQNIEGALGWFRIKMFIPLLYKRADLLITVSQALRSELIKYFGFNGNHIETIVNGFDLSEISRKAKLFDPVFETSLFSSNKVIITHCRLSRQKNLGALISVFASLRSDDAKLVILGQGELSAQLIEQSKAAGLRVCESWVTGFDQHADIYFPGYQSNPYPFLARASIYVMTSSWEGFPLALCEAQACGLPVMAADCPTGPREILAPHYESATPVEQPYFSTFGVLMPLADSPASLQDWESVLTKLLHDSEQRAILSRGGLERVKEFDIKFVQSQWLKLIFNK